MSSRGECSAARHGTRGDYSYYGCRCPDAVNDARKYQNYRRLRQIEGNPLTVPSVGTARRLQALAALGWTTRELGKRLGLPGTFVSVLMKADRRVYASTARRVAALYAEISGQPSPCRYGLRAQRAAERNGYLLPAAWDDNTIDDPDAVPYVEAVPDELWVDEVAVEAAVGGRPLRALTPPEMVEAVRRLSADGLSAAEIAERVGVSERTVTRVRSRHGIAAEFDSADFIARRKGLRRGA